jgi:AraC-like DNA-binding protein
MTDPLLDPVAPSRERKTVDFTDLGMDDIIVLGRYDYTYAHRQLPKHSHGNYFEFCLLDEGVQPFLVNDREFILKGGDVLVIQPFQNHGSGPNPENRGRFYWVILKVPDNEKQFLNLPYPESTDILHALKSLSSPHFKGNRHLKHYLEKTFEAFEGTEEHRRVEIRSWILRFILDIIRDERRQSGSGISPLIGGIQEYIDAHLSDDRLPLSLVAHRSGLSLSHFKARFKDEIGISPGNYITLRKIERAKTLLKETSRPITRIAMELGFSTSQYFSTTFKRYTGVPPSLYREQDVQ